MHVSITVKLLSLINQHIMKTNGGDVVPRIFTTEQVHLEVTLQNFIWKVLD
jgi:hypothetical protein